MSDGDTRKHVVIVGGGFGGLTLARKLGRAPVRVTVLDRENHHVFQPLLYQVATAGLSPGDIAMPIRTILRPYENVRVLMGEVVGADLDGRTVRIDDGTEIPYDYLVVAAGVKTNYYGNDHWAEHAYGLKSIRDALKIRERVLMAFEAAERQEDPERRRDLLTFVIIGAGPTGVEMAGAISELSRVTMRGDFSRFDPAEIRVMLIEASDRVLTPFEEDLSARALQQLEELHVEVRTGCRVTNVAPDGVDVDGERIGASMVLWATGTRAVSLADKLGKLGVPLERGRIAVAPDCSVPGWPEVFAIGDITWFVEEGEEAPLPGVATVAIQQAKHVARMMESDRWGTEREPFSYFDKGMMATIGRSRAVVQSQGMKLSGYIAWLAWLFIHIVYLIGFRNRIAVMLNWIWSYITFRRGARLIAQSHGPPVEELAEVTDGRSTTGDTARERAAPPPV